ncbi:MAG: hypothetical protein JRG95_15780, partial [Deltaproteobacteria bacterium]|nr:hypothetical protein [Deltaproteobacteria bacterium]
MARPDPEGVPTPVHVGLFIIDLASLDDPSQTFFVDMVINLRWKDPRLAFEPTSESGSIRILPLSRVWNPRLLLTNQRRTTLMNPHEVRVQADGSVSYRQHVVATLASALDLREFPFDRQTLWIHLASPYGPDEVALVSAPELTGRLPRFSVAGWKVELGEAKVDSIEIISGQRVAARVGLSIVAERLTGYYVWKVLVPMGLIVIMAWSVFWLDLSQLGPRIGIATASIFTLIAFQLSLSR